MGWSYKFWEKTFYPKNLNSKQYLKYYSSQLNSVEVNNTFYRIPNEKTILTWKEQTSKNFIFTIKFPRKITHFKMLINADEDTKFFLKRISGLNKKLGPLLLQFPYYFKEEKISTLTKFLNNLPKEFQYAVEVRNKKLLNNNFFSVLKENNIALVWTDHPILPLREEITADFLYIRWEGNRKKVNGSLGTTEIDQKNLLNKWALKISKKHEKIDTIFGYFSKYFSGNPIKDVQTLLDSIEKINS